MDECESIIYLTDKDLKKALLRVNIEICKALEKLDDAQENIRHISDLLVMTPKKRADWIEEHGWIRDIKELFD